MGEGIKLGGGDGNKVRNGRLENYFSHDIEIAPGNFVEYVAEGISIGTVQSNIATTPLQYHDMARVSNERVLVVYAETSLTDADIYFDLSYLLLKINENQPATLLSSGKLISNLVLSGTHRIQVKELGNDKFACMFRYSTTSTRFGVLSVDEKNTVESGAFLTMNAQYTQNIEAISFSSVLLVYSDSNNYLCARVMSISGMTATAGTVVQLHGSNKVNNVSPIILGKLTNVLYVVFAQTNSSNYDVCRLLIKVTNGVPGLALWEDDDNEYMSGTGLEGNVCLIDDNKFLVVKSVSASVSKICIYKFTETSLSVVASLTNESNSGINGSGQVYQNDDGRFVCMYYTGICSFALDEAKTQITKDQVVNVSGLGYYNRFLKCGFQQYLSTGVDVNLDTLNALPNQLNRESVKLAEHSLFGLTKKKCAPNKSGAVWVL